MKKILKILLISMGILYLMLLAFHFFFVQQEGIAKTFLLTYPPMAIFLNVLRVNLKDR
jgi:hypothetical protein